MWVTIARRRCLTLTLEALLRKPADRLGVGGIILLPFDIGLHIGRRHQLHGMTEGLQFARLIVGRCACLDADDTRRLLIEEGQNPSPLQLLTNDNLAISINAVNLEYRYSDVETDGCDRMHELLLRIVVTYRQPTSWRHKRRRRSRPQHQVLT